MRFACLSGVAPGADLAAQCAAIAAAGCAGVETLVFAQDNLIAWQAELRAATANAGLAVAAVILGGLALYTPGQEAWLPEVMHAVAELGGGVLLTPEYRPQHPLPIFPPYATPSAAEVAQVERSLAIVDDAARRYQVPVFFEPLTPFEGRFWRDVAAAQAACVALANPFIGLALDFHNMHITEANPIASIVRAGSWVRHVHLADNNRRLPGAGHIDFRAGIAALQAMGYDGWYSFECAVDGDFVPALQRAQAWLNPTDQS
jgi:sugar phosphate isomerase/epimerase